VALAIKADLILVYSWFGNLTTLFLSIPPNPLQVVAIWQLIHPFILDFAITICAIYKNHFYYLLHLGDHVS